MLVECGNCGAPLDVEGDPTFVKCRYCDRSNKVKSLRTLSMQTPATWQPPPRWTPPAHVPAPSSRALSYGATAAGAAAGATGISGCAIAGAVLGILGAVAAVVLAVVVPAMSEPYGGADEGFAPPGFGGASWDGSAPFSCGGNQVVTLSNVEASLPGQTAITVSANCQLTLDNVTITAGQGIVGGGNGRIVVTNTTIRSTGPGIQVDGNRVLEVRGSNVIASGGPAVDVGANTQATIDNCTIEGTPAAVVESGNARATVTNTTENR